MTMAINPQFIPPFSVWSRYNIYLVSYIVMMTIARRQEEKAG